MRIAAAIVVVVFGFSLITFTAVVFAKPARAERFLMAFASSARAHYLEQSCRIVVGAALIVLAPTMWQSKVFWLLGWAILISSATLICIPWQWHDRLGKRLRPLLARYLKAYSVCAFALGALLLYGVLAGNGVT